MTKTTKKPMLTSAITGESALKMASGMLETGLTGLQTYVDHMSAIVGETTDHEPAESFAHLLTKVAQVASELRKAEAAERKTAEAMTKADVMEWLRRMDQTDRARLLREAGNIDSKRSGLA